MRVISMLDDVRGLCFDIDKTLYTNDAYAEHQIDVLITRLATERNEPVERTRASIAKWRSEYAAANEGARQSLGNTFLGLGVPIATSARWREELITPVDHLDPDPLLRAVLERLGRRFSLVCVTNNPQRTGEATLDALGVRHLVQGVVGLDTTNRSKPDPAPFLHAASVLNCDPFRVISIGDRYDVDIVPALSVGMGGILVDGVGDVYRIEEVLPDE